MALCKNIIVPLDGSKLSAQALPAARLMANATRTPLTLLRSFAPLPDWHADAGHGRFSAAMAAGEHDRTLADLACLKRRMEHWGVEPPIFVEAHEGPAHEAIINFANRDPHALIVMSTHGRGGLTRMLTGSVTARVVRNVSNPTLIVRCNQKDCPLVPPHIDNILVPLDGSSFAENALDYAGELAVAFGARITLFRATPGPEQFRAHAGWSHGDAGSGFGYGDPYELSTSLAEASREYLWRKADALRARFPVFDVTVQHSLENPADAILNLAEQLDNGLVVMATRGCRGMGRALFGSVADRVVRHSTLPTFLVRGPMAFERSAWEHSEEPEFAEAGASRSNAALAG
jgi:nucleotide-binding universal stress UspA family protein